MMNNRMDFQRNGVRHPIRSTSSLLIVGAVLSTTALLQADDAEIVITFEEGVGNDVVQIGDFYSGVTFTADASGSEWRFRDGTTGNYNVSSWPSGTILGGDGQYWIHGSGCATTALDDTGNDGRIVFDHADATFVEIQYAFGQGGGSGLTLTAWNANDELLDSDFGGPNLRFADNNPLGPGTLRVEAPPDELIAYAIVSDGGNFWAISRLTTDATGIVLATVDMIDPIYSLVGSSPLLLESGEITTDPNMLSQHGESRQGITADGTTRVILRWEVPDEGNVTFSITDDNGSPLDVGSLSSTGGDEHLTTLEVDAVQLDDERWMAFAVLQAPANFIRGVQDHNVGTRTLNIEATFDPSADGEPVTTTRERDIHRTPVVLMHGLWSSASTWNWDIQNDSRFVVYRHDYSATNAESFSTNVGEVLLAVRQAKEVLRVEKNIAVTQVDFFGHSMGGILGRLFVESDHYYRTKNFYEGDFNRFITVATPHEGSPLANFLLDDCGWITHAILNAYGSCVDCGAVADLQTGATAIQETAVPAHALVGEGGPGLIAADSPTDYLEDEFGQLAEMMQGNSPWYWQGCEPDPDDLFDGELHDIMVTRSSQRGGLSTSHYTSFQFSPPTQFGIHSTLTESESQQTAETLLNAAVDDATMFASGFPAVSNQESVGLMGDGRASDAAFNDDVSASAMMTMKFGADAGGGQVSGPIDHGIVVTNPHPETIVSIGESFTVEVEGVDGFEPVSVIAVTYGSFATDNHPPFDVELHAPSNTVGVFDVVVWAIDDHGIVVKSDPVPIVVVVDSELVEIEMIPSPLVLFDFAPERQLRVTGHYMDGTKVDVSGLAGTTYESLNSDIVTVDEDGFVSGVSLGSAPVLVQHGALEREVMVHVAGIAGGVCGDLNGDGVVDADDMTLMLNALGSMEGDPDYIPEADFDNSGMITMSDWGAWLECWYEFNDS